MALQREEQRRHVSVGGEAASRINVNKDTATELFEELQRKGFIRSKQKGAFELKVSHATTWILTEFDYAGQVATKDFLDGRTGRNSPSSRGGPNLKTGPIFGQAVRNGGTAPCPPTPSCPLFPDGNGAEEPVIGPLVSDTYNIPGRGASAEQPATSSSGPPCSPPSPATSPKQPQTRRLLLTQVDLEKAITAGREAQP